MELQAGELLVARFWRWDADKLRGAAERDYLADLADGVRDPVFGVSVYGRVVGVGEHFLTAMRELCALASSNAKWVAFTTGARLAARGFEVRLNEPPGAHYDVLLGRDLAQADVDGLAAEFNEEQRRRYPTCDL